MNKPLEQLQNELYHREEKNLSPRAAISRDGQRRTGDPDPDAGYRMAFALDADRVLHSLAYTRYIDKTQVFYLVKNDHIAHRVLHVQLVSKIARTIGRFLDLNEDLIEAIALGHDIGHAPFGHEGERFLSGLCQKAEIGHFCHNVQSVQFLDRAERKGRGWNLCLQTLDGILCHDGEVHDLQMRPRRDKTFAIMDQEIAEKKKTPKMRLIPMTLEGCVVRFSDTVAYIGRDIEDAIRLNLIRRSDLPADCVRVFGDTNGKIVYRLVTDIIQNSRGMDYVAFSHEVSESLRTLKQFNYERIYLNPKIKQHSDTIEKLFNVLFEQYLSDLEKENRDAVIFTSFLSEMSEAYISTHAPAEIVRDFMAGMTDNYFLRQCPEELRPDVTRL